MNLSEKIQFIAHGNASGLCDSGLAFQIAYKMELESVSQWSEDKIELEYKLRNEYFERGGVDETKLLAISQTRLLSYQMAIGPSPALGTIKDCH